MSHTAEISVILVILFCNTQLSHVKAASPTPSPVWPPHQKSYDHRPTSDPFCQAGIYNFCPSGFPVGHLPKVKDTDKLFVYALKAPVWEFRFGDLLGKFDIMHDAIGFHHVQSGLNLTMEWYELFQLFNCTFPHLVSNKGESGDGDGTEMLWCNQGAACLYPGIDEKHWKQNGTLVKVSEISGQIFNNFMSWSQQDNNSYPFYETWTVMDGPGKNTWFKPFDCASWVLRAFDTLHDLGATFDTSVQLNYTRVELYSTEPQLLGNETSVYQNSTTLNNLVDFYGHFQKASTAEMIEHLLFFLDWFEFHKKFYIFYNAEYWELDMVEPYFGLTYDNVPLPNNKW